MVNPDVERYIDILKGKVRDDLEDRIQEGNFTIAPDGSVVSTYDYIGIPRLERGYDFDGDGEGDGDGDGDSGGVGQGPGNIGDTIDKGEGDGEGNGPKPGEGKGEHQYSLYNLEEFMELLGEKFKLPNLKPKEDKQLVRTEEIKWTSERKKGPLSLLKLPKSYRNAILREQCQGVYDEKEGVQSLIDPDLRFLDYRIEEKPSNAAVIMYTLDLSGSMWGEPRDIARQISLMFEAWLAREYPSIEKAYFVHDHDAWEVDQQQFFGLEPSGGTQVFPSLELCKEKIVKKYPASGYNIYIVQFTDGYTFGSDNDNCVEILNTDLMPDVSGYFLAAIDTFGWGDSGNLSSWHYHSQIKNRVQTQYPDTTYLTHIKKKEDTIPGFIRLMKSPEVNKKKKMKMGGFGL